MAYTILDCREITQPLVGIYPDETDPNTGTAVPVFAMVVYRDMADKGSENLLVPVTGKDMSSEQFHYEKDKDSILDSLPKIIISDQRLYDHACINEGEVDVKHDDYGWSVFK